MDRPQLIRRLRIAASVFFAVVTVALCVLWVRSYSVAIFAITNNDIHAGIGVRDGMLVAFRSDWFVWRAIEPRHSWEFSSRPITDDDYREVGKFFVEGQLFDVVLPLWIPASLLSIAICLPWVVSSFSLRTMLIATTIVAVMMGLGVWAAG